MRDGNLYDNSTEQIFVKCLASSRHDARFEDERKKFCKAAAKALQSCPSLCDPKDGSLPGFADLLLTSAESWLVGAC